jgi:hypothetical protein
VGLLLGADRGETVKRSDISTFWRQRPRAARIWGLVGVVGLFAVVTVGVYLGAGLATIARGSNGPDPATSTSNGVEPKSLIGPAGPGSTGPGPADPSATATPSASTRPAAVGQAGPVPDPPGNLTFTDFLDQGGQLAVTVRWSAAQSSGRPVTSYVASISAGSYQTDVSHAASPLVFHVPCSGACPIDGQVRVRAVNDSGTGAPASVTFHDVLPHVQKFFCYPSPYSGGDVFCEVVSPDPSPQTVWNGNPGHDGQTRVFLSCSPGDVVSMTVTVSNSAGRVIRSGSAMCEPVAVTTAPTT